VFLDPLDEAVARRGWHFVRYGDDFVLLTQGEKQAQKALDFLRATVAEMGLELKPEKTSIRPVLHGFRFLGMQMGGDLGETLLESAALRRPVIIRTPYCFAGLDHESLLLRKDKEIIDRIPLMRASQLIFHGTVSFSSKLVEACARRDIPITLCSPVGHHVHTIPPDGREQMERRYRHQKAFESLAEEARVDLARQAVMAKLAHHIHWLSGHAAADSRHLAGQLRQHMRSISTAEDVERLRGLEGAAATAVFPHLRSLILKPEFHSTSRVPFHKPDRWNCLLDFAYSQCFAHLNTLCRSSGLNPYLGFLHSPEDRFESLVADLQEPFRPRMDRWVIRCINLGIIKADDFTEQGGKWKLAPHAYPVLLESFAKECNTRFADDHATFGEFLLGQVRVFCDWADHDILPRFWMPSGWEGKNT
jgi:CRISPR-associated endonuclease Cas1